MPEISYQCRHILPNGIQCCAIALKRQAYCYQHTRLHNFQAAPQIQPGESLRLPVLEDSVSIRLAIAMVTDAICSSSIDSKRAGLLLYAIQIARQTLDEDLFVPENTVEVVRNTDTVDEMGPNKFFCDEAKCDVCPQRKDCKDRKYPLDKRKDEKKKPQPVQPPAERPVPATFASIQAAAQPTNCAPSTAHCQSTATPEATYN